MISSRQESFLREKIEGLPDSSDPYQPAKRENPSDSSSPENTPEDTDELTKEVDKLIQPQKPSKPTWRSLKKLPGNWSKMTNAKDRMYERTDGFTLRIRKLESVPNRYIAQMIRGDEILEKGFIDVPSQYDGPKAVEYIQKMADEMLDAKSERFSSEEPIAQEPINQKPLPKIDITPQEVSSEQESGESPDMDLEDLGLDDIELEND